MPLQNLFFPLCFALCIDVILIREYFHYFLTGFIPVLFVQLFYLFMRLAKCDKSEFSLYGVFQNLPSLCFFSSFNYFSILKYFCGIWQESFFFFFLLEEFWLNAPFGKIKRIWIFIEKFLRYAEKKLLNGVKFSSILANKLFNFILDFYFAELSI